MGVSKNSTSPIYFLYYTSEDSNGPTEFLDGTMNDSSLPLENLNVASWSWIKMVHVVYNELIYPLVGRFNAT
jgi:hypothetical protein